MKSFYLSGGARQLVVFLLVTALLTGCTSRQENKTKAAGKAVDSVPAPVITRGPAADTLVIDRLAAVFFTPGSLHRRQLKEQFTEAQFDGIDHECFYQMKNARTSLREHWPQIRIYEVTDTLYLQFVKEDGRRSGIDLTKKTDMCGLYIFNRKKDPEPADMMSIGTSLENYFIH
ncbi:MAG: hypothetical protein HYZ15_13680 [Sphingobacteriales bacterium]|nr:hypothetical protein [Sphingobacteriales bacterium]